MKIDFAPDGITPAGRDRLFGQRKTENIGARRLYTVMEKLLEEVSYSASDTQEKTLVIDAAYVDERLGELAVNEDLSRYVL